MTTNGTHTNGKANGKANGHANGARNGRGTKDDIHSDGPDAVIYGSDDWRAGLLLTKDDKARACFANYVHVLRNAPDWQGRLRWDCFGLRMMMSLPPPWWGDKPFVARAYTDADDGRIAEWFQRRDIFAKPHEIGAAAMLVAGENEFDPLTEYLDRCLLRWDGSYRLDRLPELFGCETTAYSIAVFRCMMISAVARAYEPGCKVDTVLTLEGGQGKQKSTSIEALFGTEFFSDDLAELGSKDAALQMAGVWCIEIADLAAMKRADVDKVKAFITRKVDRFRPPYGKNIIEVSRRSILVSTTNLDDWNKDETGGRRYWPVLIKGEVQIDEVRRLRDQLWAEARACYLAGEEWWLIDQGTIATAKEEVELRRTEDPWTKPVLETVRNRAEATAEEILTSTLQIERGRQTTFDQARIGRILRAAGWTKHRPRTAVGRLTVYVAPAAEGQGDLPF